MATAFNTFTLLAQTSQTFELARLQSDWQFLLGTSVLAALVVLAVFIYIKDAVELHWGMAVFLASLRIGAIGLLFFIWLMPQMRVVSETKENSRVLVVSDGSLSMSRRDSHASSAKVGPTRAEQVAASLKETELLAKLRQQHDVTVLKFFDDQLQAVAELPRLENKPGEPAQSTQPKTDQEAKDAAPINWTEVLAPNGAETRLGDTLQRAIGDFRSRNLAGVVIFTDGQSNTGVTPEAVIELAQQARVPIFPIGVGSTDQPINVRVDGLFAPKQVFPGDDYEVNGYVLGTGPGMAGRTVTVELVSRPTGNTTAPEETEGTQEVVINEKGQAQPVSFRLHAGDIAQKTLELRVKPVAGDADAKDDVRRTEIEIVERKLQVLLFAGGPSREYQFLRNQLFRESRRPNASVVVDVILQTARTGVAQDAREILSEFPTTASQLAQYDCIVAFDPNWLELNANQIQLLEQWVFEQAGGLVVVAGPVYTESWTQKPETELIRRLYPVEFNRRFALLDAGRFQNREPRSLVMTPEGMQANFLWIADTAPSSQQAWAQFPGVYGYYSVRGKKQGANVYARYFDPRAESSDTQPIYLADQFYGSGRVFYMGSGEMWRLRAMDEAYFDRFYTKLIRHVSAGRSQRGSQRGVLLVDSESYMVGQPVPIQAQLRDAEQKPLEVGQVDLDITLPDGSPARIALKPRTAAGKGIYAGQFIARQEGDYRIELPVPGGTANEKLTRTIQARLPNLEQEKLHRNDPVLAILASKTGGKYIIGPPNVTEVVALLPAKTRTEVQLEKPIAWWDLEMEPKGFWKNTVQMFGGTGTPGPTYRPVMLFLVCGLLALEWLVRRLCKLA